MKIWITLKERLILLGKKYLNAHKSRQKDVFIFAMPRGGSTWLLELISSQPGFKYINEPFSLRNKRVRKYFGFSDWDEYYQERNEDKIINYLKGISNGTITIMNPFPFRKFYRFFTNRTVFKIIHCCEDKLDKIINDPDLNSYAIILLRHPIAVSLSRKQLPRLASFLSTDCSENFTKVQLVKARKILNQGTNLEKGVLSWCIQNYLLLSSTSNNKSIITYEQLVLEPKIVLKHIANKICIEDIEKIMKRVNTPLRKAPNGTSLRILMRMES